MTIWRVPATVGISLILAAQPAAAFDNLNFSTPGMDEDLRSQIENNSALSAAQDEDRTGTQDVLAAALSDYGVLLETLYANGYYGGTISITLDGREASEIPLLSSPDTIDTVMVTVVKGPSFKFGTTRVAPLAPDTTLPEDFTSGSTARAGLVGEAADAAIDGWRQVGHAKADLAYQDVTANHRAQQLDVDIGIAPGPHIGGPSIDETARTFLAFSVTVVGILIFSVGIGVFILDRQSEAAAAARLNHLTESAVDGMAVASRGVIIAVNAAFEDLAARPRSALVGAAVDTILPGTAALP